MHEDSPVYELPSEIALPWVSRSLRQFMQQRREIPRSGIGASVGLLVSIMIHACLLSSVVLDIGAAAHLRRPERRSAAPNLTQSGQTTVMTMILVDTSARTTETPEEALASRALVTESLGVKVASLDRLADLQFPSVDARSDDKHDQDEVDDPARRAMLAGRYTGQIKARVERAWMRPRTALGGGSFTCRVQIVQDGAGIVQETTLQSCNGDERWQLSLVQAIQSASPLPAPPDPAVFANALTLEFHSDTYDARRSSDGFEREAVVAALAQKPVMALAKPLPDAQPKASSIRLTIQGQSVNIEPVTSNSVQHSPFDRAKH